MGNNTSSSSSTNDSKYSSSTSGKAKPGSLDAETQLEALYTEAINSKEVKEEMKTLFHNVRILVVGRSGCGKSTLIRLMVGDMGPRSIRRGEAGEQNIADEWRYPDPDLPLIFHDSNGIDVMGANRLKDIRKFLDTHQKSKDIKQRIHLVWYVFSASDMRFLDDGGLLEVLMEYEIPLLLIMTSNDIPRLFTQNVEGEPLEKLIRRIKDPSRRENILNDMIRLGNSVEVQPDGSLGGQRDLDGLKEVTHKTKNMIHKKLRSTWIACQLEALYTEAINSKEVKEEMKTLFHNVRILVVGRSGCGKSTLIRLMVGDMGPRSIRRGEAGEQNIADEWRYPDPDLPLIFHDSNGIDVMGANRLKDIRKFLDTHQKSKDIKQRIHLVWYVFSASDMRFLDDGGLLEVLMEYEIPLLLIMTSNDIPRLFTQNVEGEPLEKLIRRIKDPSRRENILNDMIRLGNRVEVQPDGSLGGQRDLDGLKEVTHKTKNMIHKKLRNTWIACQVADTNEKLEMSARLIVNKIRQEIFMTCLVGYVPLVQEAQLGYMFFAVIRSLAKIWGVPEQMEKALMAEFFIEEGGNNLLKNLFKSVMVGLGLAASIVTSIATGGVASFTVLGVFAASGFTQMRTCITLLMTFSLLVLGAILYTQISLQYPNDDWDKSLSKEAYKQYANDFACSKDAQKMKTFIFEYKSLWEGITRTNCQTRRLKGQLITVFQNLMKNRKNSLFSRMALEDEEDVQNQQMLSDEFVNDYHVGEEDSDDD